MQKFNYLLAHIIFSIIIAWMIWTKIWYMKLNQRQILVVTNLRAIVCADRFAPAVVVVDKSVVRIPINNVPSRSRAYFISGDSGATIVVFRSIYNKWINERNERTRARTISETKASKIDAWNWFRITRHIQIIDEFSYLAWFYVWE